MTSIAPARARIERDARHHGRRLAAAEAIYYRRRLLRRGFGDTPQTIRMLKVYRAARRAEAEVEHCLMELEAIGLTGLAGLIRDDVGREIFYARERVTAAAVRAGYFRFNDFGPATALAACDVTPGSN